MIVYGTLSEVGILLGYTTLGEMAAELAAKKARDEPLRKVECLLQRGLITVDEARAMLGRPPSEPEADTPLVVEPRP